jgi:hypothetical protein
MKAVRYHDILWRTGFGVAISLALLALGGLAPMAAHAQAATPTFRSASSATLGGSVNFRAASAATTTSGTLAIAKPVGTIDGDVMIASIGVRPSSATVTAPAGWILVRRINNASVAANALAVYRKLAGAAEPASYAWTLGGSTHSVGGIQSFSGVNAASPLNVENGRTTPGALTHPTPSVSTTVANTVLVTSHTFSSAASWNPPSGMTESFDIRTPAAPNSAGQAIVGSWVRQSAAGATGVKTASASNDADVGNTHILALQPAANGLSIGLPAGAAANDVLIASIGVRPSSVTIIPPAGWTLVRRINNANATANSLAVYRKVAAAAEPGSYGWTVSGATFAVGGIQAFFNVDTVNPIDVENGQSTASGLSHPAPSVTTTVANTMLVTSHTFASSRTWTPPAGMAESFDQLSGLANTTGQSIGGNREFKVAAGATGVKTATAAGDADAGNTHILALRPATATPGTDPRAVVGEWTLLATPLSHNSTALHLLPTGMVLFYGGATTGPDTRLWDPATATTSLIPLPGFNVFCSGHAFLADGRLLIAGGHIENGVGLPYSSTYDAVSNVWAPVPNMNAGRWYPTATTLANGDVLVVSGEIDAAGGVNRLPEVFQAASGIWHGLTGAELGLDLYPWMHLAPNGKVFNSGPTQTTRYLDTSGTGTWTPLATRSRYRSYGSSVMYDDGKVLVMGGGDPPTNSAEVIDLNAAIASWRLVGSMAIARRQLNATLLPDGKVLVTGGTSGPGFNNTSTPVFVTEMWDPATELWTTMASAQVSRLYHSAALLLPDGRVLSTGGDGITQVEVYSPPYLFTGARPTITSAPAAVSYGQTFFVETPDTASIAKVTWIRLPSVTHAFDQNQRINRLSFAAAPGGLNIVAPSDANLAPPGHYMLFLLDGNGAPSIARIVRIGS